MKWIKLYKDKELMAELPDDSEHLLLMYENFKLQKVANGKYRIVSIRN